MARWTALGSEVQLLVQPEHRAAAVAARAADLLTQVDRRCSRFRKDSDLTRVNRHAGEWVRVDPLLHSALDVALAAARRTDGLVDPTLGLVLSGLGYDRDLAAVRRGPGGPDATTAVIPPPVPGSWRDVETDPDRGIRIPFGRALDLGATGKAFAADLLARTLPAELDVGVLVSLGGDVAVGGQIGEDWRVVVCETPEQTATTAGCAAPPGPHEEIVDLRSGGLATSSVVRRRWWRDGRELHHLLDPRTGAPVRAVWRTASVVAVDCATANAASTGAVVLGDAAVDWLTAAGLPARLVGTDGHVRHLGDWPAAANDPTDPRSP